MDLKKPEFEIDRDFIETPLQIIIFWRITKSLDCCLKLWFVKQWITGLFCKIESLLSAADLMKNTSDD